MKTDKEVFDNINIRYNSLQNQKHSQRQMEKFIMTNHQFIRTIKTLKCIFKPRSAMVSVYLLQASQLGRHSFINSSRKLKAHSETNGSLLLTAVIGDRKSLMQSPWPQFCMAMWEEGGVAQAPGWMIGEKPWDLQPWSPSASPLSPSRKHLSRLHKETWSVAYGV